MTKEERVTEQKSLAQEFEERLARIENLPGDLSEYGVGIVFGLREAAWSVRHVLTEEEARVLRSIAESFEADDEWEDAAPIRKCLDALTEPEPEKLYRTVYVRTSTTTQDTDRIRAQSNPFACVGTESWDEVSTDNGETWERVES